MNIKTSGLFNFNEDFLSLKQTKALQAVACIGILLHHVTQQITSYGAIYIGPITFLATIGFLFTAIFFFCSGYGLIVSHYSKDNYLNHFISNRLSTIFVPFFTANIVYVIARLIMYGRVGDSLQVFSYITGLVLINSNGWFIIEIFVLYLAFYFLFRFIKKKDIALIVLCLFTVALIFYSKSLGHDTSLTDVNSHWFMGEWWYNSTSAFILGLLIGRTKNWLLPKIRKFYWPITIAALILLPITYLWEEHTLKVYGYYMESLKIGGMSYSSRTLIAQTALCLLFLVVILLINIKVSFSNKGLLAISNITFEMYLIQKLFIDNVFEAIEMPNIVRYLAVLFCSAIAAIALSFLNKYILKGFGRLISLLPDGKIVEQLKRRKKLFIGLALVCIAGIFVYRIAGILSLKSEYSDELASLQDSKVGGEVLFGHYDTSIDIGKERVPWIVIDISDNKYTLICKQAIAAGSFNDTQKSVAWTDSFIRQRLNSDEFLSMFSKQEYNSILENSEGDMISLLTVDQAAKYFETNRDRQVGVTEIAEADGANVNSRSKMNEWDFKDNKTCWWWIRSTANAASTTAPYINVDGEIVEDSAFVCKSAGAIRPVVTVVVEGANSKDNTEGTTGATDSKEIAKDSKDVSDSKESTESTQDIPNSEESSESISDVAVSNEVGPYQVEKAEAEGDYDFTYDELTHRLIICQPKQIDENTDIILMLHGYGSKASEFQQITAMDTDATKRNYIVVYITGSADKNDPTSAYGWNASWNSGLRPSDKDDVGLLRAVVDYIQKDYELQSPKSFVAGFSNGAFMTFRLAYEAVDTFTACASVSGRMPADMWERRGDGQTSGFLQINGTNDDVVPMKLNGTDQNSNDPAIEDVIAEMARANNCQEIETDNLSTQATITKYAGDSNKQIWEVVITDGTHCWPDETMAGFNVNQLILDFFDTYR